MRFKIPLRVLILLFVLLAVAQVTQAHGYIVRAIPEDRVTLQRPPARLQYWFSEDLEPNFSTLVLRDQTGAVLAEGGVDPDNLSLMLLQVPEELPDGAYLVDLRPAFASDGHVVAQTRVFFVGEAVGGVTGSGADYSIVPLEVVWRVMLYASILLLFGLFVLYAHVLLPAWGNPQYQAGLLPPRVMRRLVWIAAGALALAFAGNIVAILQQSMVFFNTGLAEVIEQGLWQVVRIGSRFGDMWTARMLLLVLVVALLVLSLRWRRERPETTRAFWTASVWVTGLMLGTFSATSHAAGSLILPWVALFVDWLHTLAVGAWVGGLAALTLVLPPALAPYEQEGRRQALFAVLRRFSRLAVGMLALVVATGVYSSLNWLYQPSDLTQTGWGVSLIVKLGLVGSLLLLGLVHHMAANPERYRRWTDLAKRTGVQSLRLESLLALVVLVAVALLSASAVPEPTFLTQSISAPDATQTVGDYAVHMAISPGGPGVNTYDVSVTEAGASVNDAEVTLQVVAPAQDWRSDWLGTQPVDSGAYVVAGDEISIEGEWWALVDIIPENGETLRAAFDWQISREAAVPESIDPGPLNILAGIAVLITIIWVSYPMLRRLYRWLDWQPVSVAAGASAVVVTVLLIVFAINDVNQSEAVYNATVSPPPSVVNTVLPDADSLAQGRELYIERCISWQSVSGDFNALKERLSRIRDEELFFATRDGWRGLPPCSGDLTDEQRWHIVNFFRTLV